MIMRYRLAPAATSAAWSAAQQHIACPHGVASPPIRPPATSVSAAPTSSFIDRYDKCVRLKILMRAMWPLARRETVVIACTSDVRLFKQLPLFFTYAYA